jgi:protein-tyrosine-phosphatase
MSNFSTDIAFTSAPADATRPALAFLIPSGARRFIRRYIDLDARARRVFLRRTIRRLARRQATVAAGPTARCGHIVFVCHGNILRSAFAAALLIRKLQADQKLVVSSAGLHAQVAQPADPRGVDAARFFDVDLRPHRAAPLTAELVRAADMLIVMDFANEAECTAWFPEAATKLRLLGSFDSLPGRRSVEIQDPYTLDGVGVRRCYDEVARCIDGLRAVLPQRRDTARSEAR